MKERVEMPSNERIRAVARKCPDAEDVLKGLFPEAFEEKEKEIELKDGQIWRAGGNSYIRLCRIDYNTWFMDWLYLIGEEKPKTTQEVIKKIKGCHLTLCPNANIKVKENETH